MVCDLRQGGESVRRRKAIPEGREFRQEVLGKDPPQFRGDRAMIGEKEQNRKQILAGRTYHKNLSGLFPILVAHLGLFRKTNLTVKISRFRSQWQSCLGSGSFNSTPLPSMGGVGGG